MKTRRISIFLPSFAGGGAEKVMVILANSFAERGHHVKVVVGKAQGPRIADLSDQVEIVDLKVRRLVFGVFRLSRHFREDRPDAVLSALTHANVICLIAAMLSRRPPRIVISERNSLSAIAADGQRLKMRVRNFLVRRLYPRADMITLVSRDMLQPFKEYLRLPDEKFVVICNPLEQRDFDKHTHTQPTHPWLRSKQGIVIVGAGRLAPQKDFSTLLSAFAIFRKTSPAKLIIFGEGPDRSALLEQAERLGLGRDVDFPGFQPDVIAEIRASDMFVLSSRWEGFPNVLLEALACGVPVVSTDCPTGPAEILENGRWGRMVPVGEPEQLASAMAGTIETPADPVSASHLRRFELDAIVDQYLAALNLESGCAALAGVVRENGR